MPKILVILVLVFMLSALMHAQRGNVIIPVGQEISVPAGAQICADTIFANNPGFGTLTLANSSGVCAGTVIIPVELISLSAALRGHAVLLEWRTAAETNCAGYEVQRSVTGDWRAVGYVAGNGTTTSERKYQYADDLTSELKSTTVLMYRLRMIDVDGSYSYSSEVEVHPVGVGTFALFAPYPSPARERLTVPFTLPSEKSVSLAIYDLTGAIVTAVVIDRLFTGGFHVMTVNTTGLCSGTYLVEVRAGNERRTSLFGVMAGK